MKSNSIFFIAEAGVNHNGSLINAKKLVDIASEAGADAIKFQIFDHSLIATSNTQMANYQKRNLGSNYDQQKMLKELELKESDFKILKEYCSQKNIEFLATAFDKKSLDFLISELNPRILKIASGDLTNLPFLIEHANSEKQIILSTGMGNMEEISEALFALQEGYEGKDSRDFKMNDDCMEYDFSALKNKVTILQCTTDYPARFEDLNLDCVNTIRDKFNLNVGFSDHSLGIEASIAAAALGATIIEKHFTISRDMVGPDHSSSLEPIELKALIKSIKNVQASIGLNIKAATEQELKNMPQARKSVIAKIEIKQGDFFTFENLIIKRPGDGLYPKMIWDLIGKRSSRDYNADEKISSEEL